MNITRIIIAIIAATCLLLGPFLTIGQAEENNVVGQEIIESYFHSHGIPTPTDPNELQNLMMGILLGDYPELTGPNSVYITTEEELGYVLDFAADQAGVSEKYSGYGSPAYEDTEATFNNTAPGTSFISHNRGKAIEYAYEWSLNGGKDRNILYPDFEDDDCTNFVSQAMNAGGLAEKGAGDGCKYEVTFNEWYVEKNSNPPIWCWGEEYEWQWSTAWSVPQHFREYFYLTRYGKILGRTKNWILVKYLLSPGDVIFLTRFDENTNAWLFYHTMLVTKEDDTNIYVTYHSNEGGLDVVDRPLDLMPTDDAHKFSLMRIIFPEVYLPVMVNGNIRGYYNSLPSQQSPSSSLETGLENLNPYPDLLESVFDTPISPYPVP